MPTIRQFTHITSGSFYAFKFAIRITIVNFSGRLKINLLRFEGKFSTCELPIIAISMTQDAPRGGLQFASLAGVGFEPTSAAYEATKETAPLPRNI